MYGLGAETNFTVDPMFVAKQAAKSGHVWETIEKHNEKKKREAMLGWGIGIAALAAVGIGGYFVYTRYIQE